MPVDAIAVEGRMIGPGYPPFVVAEMSGNHNGDLGRALALVEVAKEAGADAVKLQTYTADTLTIDHDSADFRIKGGLWDGHSLYRLYEEAHTPWEWHEALFAKGREVGITVFSAPFDATALEFLEGLGAPAHKIASFELVDLPLVEKIAATGKPLIASTGMADRREIDEAVNTMRGAGATDLVLLHCVSGYPTAPADANLRTMMDLSETHGVVTGLSDHTMGIAVSIAAVALGASLIEKHFTLHREDGGPDAAFSLESDELSALVQGCRTAWESLGSVTYERTESERPNVIFRRSLYIVKDIAEGEVFTAINVRSIRPGHGMAPKQLPEILGRRAARDLKRGTALESDMVAE